MRALEIPGTTDKALLESLQRAALKIFFPRKIRPTA